MSVIAPSTQAQSEQTRGYMAKSAKEHRTLVNQITSGETGNEALHIKRIKAFEDQSHVLKASEHQKQSNNAFSTELTGLYDRLGTMHDIVSEAVTNLMKARSDSNATYAGSITGTIQVKLDEFVGLLNARSPLGNYMFSGSRTDAEPITQNMITATQVFAYYNGDHENVQINAGPGVMISNVYLDASNSSFDAALRGLYVGANAGDDTAQMGQAQDLLKDAQEGIASMMALLGTKMKEFEHQNEVHEKRIERAEDVRAETNSVNLPEAMMREADIRLTQQMIMQIFMNMQQMAKELVNHLADIRR